MLVCDACNTGYHTHCLQLPGIPSTPLWVCPVCTTEGITADSLEKKLREAPGAAAPEKDLFLTPNQRKEEDVASTLDGVVIDTSPTEPNTPTVGRLRFVRRDRRSHANRKKPLLLESADRSIAAEPITLRKALRLQNITLQVPHPAAIVSLAALVKPALPQQFDLSSPSAVQAAHLIFGISLSLQSATTWFQRFNQAPAQLSQQDCVNLLSSISLHPVNSVLSMHPDQVLSAAIATRYSIRVSSPDWPAGLLPPQFVVAAVSATIKKRPADWVFTSAAPGTECLALALAAEHATSGAFILAPFAAVSAAPLELRQLRHSYKCSDRLALIQSPRSRTHMWIAVFASLAARSAAISVGGPTSHTSWVIL
jgi:hypothetical protein